MCIAGPNGTAFLRWDWRLVTLSVSIAVIGSFAALECLERGRQQSTPRGRERLLLLGAALMGLAIWTMHFVGMLALRMPVPVSYAPGWSAVSICAAAAGAALAFWLTMQRDTRPFDLALGGIAMGVAIVSMHYLGMKSMRMPLLLDYQPARFFASVAIAVTASWGALWVSHRCSRVDCSGVWMKSGGGILLGLAIAGMHYMGMAAARYHWASELANRANDPSVGAMPLRDFVDIAGVIFAGALMAIATRTAVERERAVRKYERLAAELESRIEERTSALQRMNDDLTAFTDSVSHDLRGPLRTIGGFADAVLDSHADQLDATGRHYVQRIKAGAERLDELLLGLLKLSKISRIHIQRTEVDLTQLAHAVLDDLSAGEPGRVVRTVVANGLRATGDRALLISVLQNLLSNAWKFTREEPNACIEFFAERPTAGTVFVVRDNGIGFDSRNASKLFGMFERMHHPSQFAGHGIGLALTRRIIERHGGTIWAESMPGRGATFYFTLP